MIHYWQWLNNNAALLAVIITNDVIIITNGWKIYTAFIIITNGRMTRYL